MKNILNITNLVVQYPVAATAHTGAAKKLFTAVNDVSLDVAENEIVGLVGESGCGKSTLARACMRLLPIAQGSIEVNGTVITKLPQKKLRPFRSFMQMVFQDPYASLNPRMTVYDTLAEPLHIHRRLRGQSLGTAVSELMESVGLSQRMIRKYPHEFSGGQRQRIAIARCLGVNPRLIIADEPVSALDVSVQAQILNLLSDLSKSRNLAMVFISHDLSVVRYLCSRIYVMYRGKIVESGPAQKVFAAPTHPYTRTLIDAIAVPDPQAVKKLQALPEHTNIQPHMPSGGCAFCDRCPDVSEPCLCAQPSLKPIANDNSRAVACFRHAE